MADEVRSMDGAARPLAVVTGASTGIGLELAHRCAADGFDLIVAADEGAIDDAAVELAMAHGGSVEAVFADLSTGSGVAAVLEAIAGRSVDALLANAGRGLGHGFLDQDFDEVRHVIDTNITGTLALVQRVGRDMRARGRGRILITGSIAGFVPGTYQAVYNGSKAFIDSFAYALRAELRDTGVSVTCLMPGPTETAFFERADLLDTKLGQQEKADPAAVAQSGFEAMMRGDADVVTGWRNKLEVALSGVLPPEVLAERHRKMTEPGSAPPR